MAEESKSDNVVPHFHIFTTPSGTRPIAKSTKRSLPPDRGTPVSAEAFLELNPTPTPSVLARERSVAKSKTGQNRKHTHLKTEGCNPTLVRKRISEHKDDHLIESPSGRLFCKACKTSVSYESQSTVQHLATAIHARNLERLKQGNKVDADVADWLEQSQERKNGDTLDINMRVARLKLTKSVMVGGVEFSKLDDPVSDFGSIVADGIGKFSVQGLRDMIPDVKQLEMNQIKEELRTSKAPLSIIFDGTTNVCEVMALLVRWLDLTKGCIEQRLIAAGFWERSMDAKALSAAIVDTLSRVYQIEPSRVHFAIRDGCSTNTSAVQKLKDVYQNLNDVHCSSHAANNAGELFACPIAHKFSSSWSSLLSSSKRAENEFRRRIGRKGKRNHKIRWGAKFLCIVDIYKNWSAVLEVLDVMRVLKAAPELSASMLAQIRDYPSILLLELAIIVDAGQIIYDFVYDYEGDGFLAHKMHLAKETVLSKLHTVAVLHLNCPSVTAVIDHVRITDPGVVAQDLLAETCIKAKPVYIKFQSYFLVQPNGKEGRMVRTYQMFNAFSILNPYLAHSVAMESIIPCIDHILTLPGLLAIQNLRGLLINELPVYYAASENVPYDVDVLLWWFGMKGTLPTWYSYILPEAVLFQPTSCAAERVFSMFKTLFNDAQEAALADYKEFSVICRYNKKERQKL